MYNWCRSVKIQKNKVYRIGMVLNKASTKLLSILNSKCKCLQFSPQYSPNPDIWSVDVDVDLWIVETLRLVGIRWECAHGGSTRRAPSSLSALANLMIRSGMVSSGWKSICWCTSNFINCSGLSFSPGLRTRAGQPAEENTNLKLPKIWIWKGRNLLEIRRRNPLEIWRRNPIESISGAVNRQRFQDQHNHCHHNHQQHQQHTHVVLEQH